MKAKIYLDLSGEPTVRCYCGTITDFCRDINDFIIPVLADNIFAEFNYKRITISPYDNTDTLMKKFRGR